MEACEDRRFAEKAIIVTQLVYEAYRTDAEYFSGDFPLSSSFNECKPSSKSPPVPSHHPLAPKTLNHE
jgi:hypothetical protein